MTPMAQKLPDKKFYYAFNEKIFIDEIPDKFVIEFKEKQTATELKQLLIQEVGDDKKVKSQNETTVTIDLSGSDKSLNEILNSKMAGVDIIKPAYKYQKQEIYYTDEILVEPLSGQSINEVIEKIGLINSVIIQEKEFYSILKISSNLDACDIANKIQESGLVKYSHPNFIMPIEKHQVIPNDTYFNNQFYLRNTGQVFNPVENHSGLPNADINASRAWTTTLGNNSIIVAVIDEGLTPNHPDLPNARQVRLNGSNFVPGENANDPTPATNNNHGNSCAGIIAATQNNNEGITGIAPNVRIMPIKIFGQNSNADNNGLASAIDFAWQHGAHVISNSWGFSGVDNPNFVPAIVAAINRAVTQGRGNLGCVVAFSASNTATHSLGGNGIISFPSNVQINGVLTVGASDRNDHQSDYSPTSNAASPNNQIIDVVAPSHRAYPPAYGGIAGEGFEVWTIDIPGLNGYNQWNDADFPGEAPAFHEILPTAGTNNLSYTGRMGGTSAACPQVAAVAALILSFNNSLTQQQVFDVITQSAERVGGYVYNANGWSPQLGHGRLNACAALNRIPNRYPINGSSGFCTSTSYTIPGLPVGSTITWSSSNTTIATINPSGVATKQNNGIVTFTATVNIPNRCGIATSRKVNVVVGTPPVTVTAQKTSGQGEPTTYLFTATSIPGVNYAWYVSGMANNPQQTGALNQFDWYFPCNNTRTIYCIVTNSCGSVTSNSVSKTGECIRTFAYLLSPNPANFTVTVSAKKKTISEINNSLIDEIKIYDLQGNLKQQQKLGKTKTATINISGLNNGTYFVEITNGLSKERQQLIIQK